MTEPDRWTDLLRVDDYPEDLVEAGASKRQRRAAQRQYRDDSRRSRAKRAAQRRHQEPVSGTAVLVVGAILAAAVLLIPLLIDKGDEAPAAAATSAAPRSSTPTPSTTATTAATAPLPAKAATVDAVLASWASAYFTRTPGQSVDAVLDTAGTWMTSDLQMSLSGRDPMATYLEEAEAGTTLTAAAVTAPREGAAPVDTDLRATRLVTVHTVTNGGPDDGKTLSTPLLVELALVEGEWKVASFSGGPE
jgi:hypothetical protein